jgi:hypothetical protein
MHHFGPFNSHVEELVNASSTFYSLLGPSQLVWRVLTTDAVNAAIISADRVQRRRRQPTANKENQLEDVVEDDEEMRE